MASKRAAERRQRQLEFEKLCARYLRQSENWLNLLKWAKQEGGPEYAYQVFIRLREPLEEFQSLGAELEEMYKQYKRHHAKRRQKLRVVK